MRTDAIIPANYESWNDYSLPSSTGGYIVPRMGVDCADPIPTFDGQGRVTGYTHPVCNDTGRCCVASTERHARRDGRSIYGVAGKCGVCGAHFKYGSMFRHEPTGEIVHMGHDCAQKYEMMFDLSSFELAHDRLRDAHAKAIARKVNESARQAFYDAHPGIESALELGKLDGTKAERILADMAGRFITWRELSDKQVAFALKLADEIRNPKPDAVELHCDAPLGKGVEFEGEIVSTKISEGFRGESVVKFTVKVTAAGGATWLAWGTCPRYLTDNGIVNGGHADLRGRRVAVKASLELPRPRDDGKPVEKHFVFMGRPTATFADLVDHPRYEVPKCVIGEPCRIICRKFNGCSGEWTPVICDGSCKNVAKVRKPRAKKGATAE